MSCMLQDEPAQDIAPAKAGKSNPDPLEDRCKTHFHTVSALTNQYMPTLVDRLIRVFGWYDRHGDLHPTPDATAWNWEKRGLFLTSYHNTNGLAEVLFVVTNLESWIRLVKTLVFYSNTRGDH